MSDKKGSSNLTEKVLVFLLRVSGILLVTAVIPAIMPFAWMDEIHQQLGMGDLPRGPIIGYLTRSLSAMYAMHGALVLFVSWDVRRHLSVVKCLAVLLAIFGVGMFILDIMVGMPWFWILGEGPLIVISGGVFLWLAGRIDRGQDTEARHDYAERLD